MWRRQRGYEWLWLHAWAGSLSNALLGNGDEQLRNGLHVHENMLGHLPVRRRNLQCERLVQLPSPSVPLI